MIERPGEVSRSNWPLVVNTKTEKGKSHPLCGCEWREHLFPSCIDTVNRPLVNSSCSPIVVTFACKSCTVKLGGGGLVFDCNSIWNIWSIIIIKTIIKEYEIQRSWEILDNAAVAYINRVLMLTRSRKPLWEWNQQWSCKFLYFDFFFFFKYLYEINWNFFFVSYNDNAIRFIMP